MNGPQAGDYHRFLMDIIDLIKRNPKYKKLPPTSGGYF